MEFRWNDWNIEHLAKHGVDLDEAELVVSQARSPYPVARPMTSISSGAPEGQIGCYRLFSSWMMTGQSS